MTLSPVRWLRIRRRPPCGRPVRDQDDGIDKPGDVVADTHSISSFSLYLEPLDEGEIAWGTSPFAPEEYPDATPLLAFGMETIVGFTVGEPCAADLDQNGEVGFGDLLALLFAWGPCEGCDEDLDDNGAVEFDDLLTLLIAWGPCS